MKILSDLKATSSRLEKQRLLRQCNHPWLVQTFKYAYDKSLVFGQKFPRVDYDRLGEPSIEMFQILDKLNEGLVTGHAARSLVEQHAEGYGELIKLICNKDLDCGVSTKLFNTEYPGGIPNFEVQLAKEVPLEQVKFPVIAQIKYDGVRITILKAPGQKTVFKTRNGKIVHLPQLGKLFERLPVDGFMLDTEVTFLSGKTDDRTTIAGKINSAIHGNPIDETALRFHVFDAMHYHEFIVGSCSMRYNTRYKYLVHVLQHIRHDSLVPAFSVPCDNPKEVEELYAELIKEGYEGLILKRDDHKYTFKRSKDWVKMKETKTADLTCVSWEEGTGKYEGMIGALLLEGVVEGYKVLVKAGSGLSDYDRSLAPNGYMGKTIEVKYNSVIQDSKSGSWSLFLPRFVSVRIDK